MDVVLRCNSLSCRKQVEERAVVTTCRCAPSENDSIAMTRSDRYSHIFCLTCSDHYNLSNRAGKERACPACQTKLINLDDVVVAELNPSEDYKTSVLSGLSPTVIMECAGRGLAFFSYQAAQEV